MYEVSVIQRLNREKFLSGRDCSQLTNWFFSSYSILGSVSRRVDPVQGRASQRRRHPGATRQAHYLAGSTPIGECAAICKMRWNRILASLTRSASEFGISDSAPARSRMKFVKGGCPAYRIYFDDTQTGRLSSTALVSTPAGVFGSDKPTVARFRSTLQQSRRLAHNLPFGNSNFEDN